MSDVIKIKIHDDGVFGGSPVDKDNLKGCYFAAPDANEVYLFFGAGDDRIPTIPEFLTVGTPGFQFIRAGMLWTVSDFDIDLVNLQATGHWSNPRHPAGGDDDGHFQAMAGGVEESAASAGA